MTLLHTCVKVGHLIVSFCIQSGQLEACGLIEAIMTTEDLDHTLAGFRPVDPGVAAEFAADFPAPQKLWTIADLGGWASVDAALFDKDNGAITAIYKKATG